MYGIYVYLSYITYYLWKVMCDKKIFFPFAFPLYIVLWAEKFNAGVILHYNRRKTI